MPIWLQFAMILVLYRRHLCARKAHANSSLSLAIFAAAFVWELLALLAERKLQ